MKKGKIGIFVIGSAFIWAAVFLGSSYFLKGTGCYHKIQNVLAGGFILHMILIWGPLLVTINKMFNVKSKDDNESNN